MIVVVVALVLTSVAACGGKKPVTTADRFAQILGHAPKGVAADVAKSGKLVIVNDDNYPPQSSLDPKTEELSGFDVDVARKVCEILGLEPQFKQAEPETIPLGLKKWHFDVAIDSLMVTTDAARTVSFTKPYYFTPGQVIVKRGGPQIESVNDLTGLSVGVAADTVFADFLRKHPKVTSVVYVNEDDLVAALVGGSIDAGLLSATSAQLVVDTNKRVVASGKPIFYQGLAFATRLGEDDLISLLDSAIAKMQADGSLQVLSQRWFLGLDLSTRQ